MVPNSRSRRRNCRGLTSAVTAGLVGVAGVAAIFAPASTRAQIEVPEWHFDWVALTVARNGAWGAATNASIMRAMMQAIAECRRQSGTTSSDCGGEITTVRAAWSLAYACGEYTFISNGQTASDARIAAIDRAIDLKDILGLELEPCTLLVAVGTDGAVQPPTARRETLSIPRSAR